MIPQIAPHPDRIARGEAPGSTVEVAGTVVIAAGLGVESSAGEEIWMSAARRSGAWTPTGEQAGQVEGADVAAIVDVEICRLRVRSMSYSFHSGRVVWSRLDRSKPMDSGSVRAVRAA